MFSTIKAYALKPVVVGSKAVATWQVGLVGTCALYVTYKMYKHMTRPKYGFHTHGKTYFSLYFCTLRVLLKWLIRWEYSFFFFQNIYST